MNLRLRSKVFLGLFLLASIMTLASGYIFYRYQKTTLKNEYIKNHSAIAEVIANNLKQAENLTDQLMLNTAYAIEELIHDKIPTKTELQAFRDRFRVTDLYLIDKTGKFIESTDDFAQSSTFNFFSFCESYKSLLDKPFSIDQTPILLAHPPNNEKPYKFTHLTTRNKNFIVEVGIHLSYIQEILKSSLRSYPSINAITLKTPAGQALGKIISSNLVGEATEIQKRVEANDSQCCQCKTKKLTAGNYYYDLDFQVSLAPVYRDLKRLLKLIVFVEIILLILCFLFSHFISKTIMEKFEKLTDALDKISNTDKLKSAEVKFNDRDINSISNSFNRMIERLAIKEAELIDSEIIKAKYTLSNQVVHDIKSPLTSLEYLVKNVGGKLEEKERLIAIQSLERISDILSSLGGKKQDRERDEPRVEIIDPMIKRIISEKRLEFKSKNNIELRLNNNIPYGTFVKISKTDFYRTMSNLINNSGEAAFQDKKLFIDITLSTQAGECVITIKDNGRGIPEDAISRVFQHGVSIGKDSGSGIGLTSAKETIEKYKGSLSLSSHEGEGTVVIIELPIVSAPGWFQTELKITTSNICIIDDDDSIHSIWDEILSGKNLSITHIKSSDEFELWFGGINKSDFSFLFDLELLGSKINGLELIEKFNLETRSTLVTSHYDDKSVQDQAQKLGVKIIPKDSASSILIDFSPAVPRQIVLIDDDKLIHAGWQMAAAKRKVDLSLYFTIDDFIEDAHRFPKDVTIYIDSTLSNGVNGEIESKKIYDLGFKNLILASGFDFDRLPFWIKGSQGKGFPQFLEG
jgi:signal transduction histidine kinase